MAQDDGDPAKPSNNVERSERPHMGAAAGLIDGQHLTQQPVTNGSAAFKGELLSDTVHLGNLELPKQCER